MRLLTVPNWSFGREKSLLRRFEEILTGSNVEVHYCAGDLDHNRTVTAFSGEPQQLVETISLLAEEAFERIDLNKHVGVHPRIGALDVCPFVVRPGEESTEALEAAQTCVHVFSEVLALTFGVPVFLYEKSEQGRHEADLPSLRKGGFGGLLDKELRPDYGPRFSHPRLGVSVVGVRDFLIAMNVNLASQDLEVARVIAKQIRELRSRGDDRFLGVRALGLPLLSRHQVQISLNLTLPDLVDVDPLIEWIWAEAAKHKVQPAETELIGVIRRADLLGATRLPVRPEQVVDQVTV
jgi:glutamate formiminotransferase / 5-formyltetrahydrofolate cyclo-ligase